MKEIIMGQPTTDFKMIDSYRKEDLLLHHQRSSRKYNTGYHLFDDLILNIRVSDLQRS
jgi:hypothetical protein